MSPRVLFFLDELPHRAAVAGAQGEHKLLRGYEPIETYSAHAIADPRLEKAVAQFLREERREMARVIEAYAEHTPFRKGEVQQERE